MAAFLFLVTPEGFLINNQLFLPCQRILMFLNI